MKKRHVRSVGKISWSSIKSKSFIKRKIFLGRKIVPSADKSADSVFETRENSTRELVISAKRRLSVLIPPTVSILFIVRSVFGSISGEKHAESMFFDTNRTSSSCVY